MDTIKTSSEPSVMTKDDAIMLLTRSTTVARGSLTIAAARMGMPQPAFSKWPKQLLIWQADQVRGAAVRYRIKIPRHLKREPT